MRGKVEQDPRRERARASDQADRSDNTASCARRFEIFAEQCPRDGLFFAEFRNSLSFNYFIPFNGNQ